MEKTPENTVSTAIVAFFTACIVLVTCFLSYQARKYNNIPPGPKGWPFLGSLPSLAKDPVQYLNSLARQYGSVFSMYMGSRLAVVLNDYEAVYEAFDVHGDTFSGRPDFFLLQVGKDDRRGVMHGRQSTRYIFIYI